VIRIFPDKAEMQAVPQMVQARGLPGSVDKGDNEQRGMQLRVASPNERSSFEFLHILVPFKTGHNASEQAVSVTNVSGHSFSVQLPDGRKDIVCLKGDCDGVPKTHGPAIVRLGRDGKLQKAIRIRE
jgi:hypothetical protein